MNIKPIFLLSMTLDSGSFKKVWKQCASKKDGLETKDGQYYDLSLNEKGLIFLYRNSQYQKKLSVLVNPAVIKDNLHDTAQFIRKLDKRLTQYFHAEYCLDDFTLYGMYLNTNLDVGSSKNAAAYLKVLHRLGKVKGFSPSNREPFDDDSCFCLNGNSNAISCSIYNCTRAILCLQDHQDISSKQLKKMLDDLDGILQIEIQLTKPKAIRCYTSAETISGQITELSAKSHKIFMDILAKIVPYGDFYKKEKAIKIIQNRVKNDTMRKKMLSLLGLIPEKKSLLMAQKATNCRHNDEVMRAFADIGLSPITICKRQKEEYLQNLYNFILE